ncbi:MAG: folylpolyglutamate synthase/dihydrofolate synthase family protein [Gemmatimonadaceae bacterium]
MDVSLTHYPEALERLFARTTGASKLGLERTLALLDRLGNPQVDLPVFHIAGTNGKGSVAATVETLLKWKGLRVGKYTSPHLVDFRERIVVDGTAIPASDVATFIDQWSDDIDRVGATFFEATTVMALDYMKRSAIDVAVVEVGLGGRLDATNVVQPIATAVVSIGRDHTELLGETLEKIAHEKAGIFKAGVPAVIGERDIGLRGYLRDAAIAAEACPVFVVADAWEIHDTRVGCEGTSFTLTGDGEHARVTTPLRGRHQAANCATAMALARAAGTRYGVPFAEVSDALAQMTLPGRFDQRGRFIFDVAHNPAGASVLADTLTAVAPARPLWAVVSILREKDWRGMIDVLARVVDGMVITTAPSAPPARAWNAVEAQAFAKARGIRTLLEPSLADALAKAERRSASVLVTGSFHTVGDAMICLQAAPPAA